MEQRGRKSRAKLTVVATLPTARPRPPAELSPEAAAIWRSEVALMPPTWFRGSLRSLADLCRRTARLETLERAMASLEVLDPEGAALLPVWHDLRDATDKETRQTIALRRQMRLSLQAQRSPDAGSGASKRGAAAGGDGPRPWNDPV